MGRHKLLTKTQLEYFKQIQAGKFKEEVAALMNDRFPGLNLQPAQIKTLRRTAGVKAGTTLVGIKRSQLVSNPKSRSWMPVGSIVKTEDGFCKKKVADKPPRWEFLHRLVWEEAHGPIPDGYRILFLDGNHENISLENLELVKDGEHGLLNMRGGRLSNDAELTKAQINIIRLQKALAMRKGKGG